MMPDATTSLLAAGSGSIVGLVLGLVGGGSILAVPLFVYVVRVSSPPIAIGTSALALSVSALGNLGRHWRAGNVKWRGAAVFAGAGVLGAATGSTAAKALDGEKLLAQFGIVMIVVGVLMLRRREAAGDPDVRLSDETARELLPLLLGIGFGVGVFSGFFGIGGGFLIVPGLIVATGWPPRSAHPWPSQPLARRRPRATPSLTLWSRLLRLSSWWSVSRAGLLGFRSAKRWQHGSRPWDGYSQPLAILVGLYILSRRHRAYLLKGTENG